MIQYVTSILYMAFSVVCRVIYDVFCLFIESFPDIDTDSFTNEMNNP